MKKNESNLDRIVRIVLAIVFLVVAYLWLVGVWQTVFYVLGLVLLFTGVSGFCGLYKLFGINTCKVDNINTENPQ
jgi:predicted tellurium resistance membrane protein TerC